ncbi:polyketide synthase [Trichoderma afarasin]
MAKSEFTTEPIAIVGSSCRFPGSSSSPSKLWELLKNPKDILKEIPESRFNPEGFYNDNGEYHGSTNVRHSYLLDEDFREFDHNFFNIHPKEAESMDPQQRMLLEIVFECIEAAGYSIQEMKGSQTAIFVGQMTQDYSDLLLRDVDSAPQYAATGISRAILSNRVSYFFDWKGPSSTIDTACSSSLVALHHAVQTLRSGESSLAVAAGVNLILGPDPYILESKLHMLSPTGRSRMWDAGADGYARGEGFASVLLKTLSQAIADGDHIECIIRETGVNQDGRTSGITMPSSTSQTALIRSTYARAGLDWRKKEDRCQYFEAHGTGTNAGDPIEARAVRDAFFPENDEDEDRTTSLEGDEPLYVGSIKTVIGHLEGTAGLAGLLKASLAIQNATIPPNMHFHKLNPKISPFYTHLHVPTKARAWPTLPPGTPRRASVNSFGFGGTNAHVILESWAPEDIHQEDALQVPCGPLTLARHISEALKAGKITNLSNLAWTMQCRRTQFPYKMYKLDDVESKSNSIATKGIHVTEDLPARILGVFTGQGAQWPSMGRRLYEKSSTFKCTIDRLEESLKNLPDAPSWSLVSELMAPPEKSRIHEAAISQPLCTALQVALVDLLYASGITFSAVVGHSSGEIGAAYAAGYIEAADAIRIAYYRGVHAHLAGGPNGQKGKMMAVGMGLEQARAFCSQDKLAGRIHVAASNSRSSVTLSGDADAVDEAKELLDSQQSFARLLKVDKAYHSHHMQPCAGPYLESLQKLNIQISTDKLKCKWYSSVYGSNGRSIDNTDAFKDIYWVDNMVKPVLFSQAIDRAVTEEHCHDIALEVGPHFALKAPASESLKNLTGQDDMEAFSDALGFIWSKFQSPSPVVDFAGFRKACFGDDVGRAMTLKGLPPYPWDHASKLWKESRKSRIYRSRKNPIHELLGYPTSHGNNQMEWLRGHIFQNQVLFPAAGYVSMAYEASIRLAAEHEEVRLVELEDLVIHRAITLEDDAAGTEVTFTIRVIDRTSDNITAEYSCYSCKVDGEVTEHSESTNFTGHALPPRIAPKLPMKPVGVDRLYKYMEQVGLRYTGDFTIEAVERRLNVLRLHPATLDAAFHGIFTALAFPGDGQLWTPYLPTNVRPSAFADASSELLADCYLRDANSKKIQGDIQLHALTCSSFTKATPQNDHIASGIDPEKIEYLTEEEVEYGDTCERLAYFYHRRLRDAIKPEDIPKMDEHFQIQFDWIVNYLLPKIEAGQHPRIKKEWVTDTAEDAAAWRAKYPGMVELQMISALGEVQPSILRGELPALQVMMQDDMLTRLYAEAVPFRQTYSHLVTVTSQLAHRYPRLKVLEIGAGTGGASVHMLKELVGRCHSYTYTDISAGFFEAAQERFREYSSMMEWAGFEEHYFDSLKKTLANCRTLLKAGGYLILNEVTNDAVLPQFISSHLPGWWLGRDDGRIYYLLATGFSGVDAAYRDYHDPKRYLASLIVSQAVDERINVLRDPTAWTSAIPPVDDLIIIGGQSPQVEKIVQTARDLLQPIASNVTLINRLEDVREVPDGATVLVLSELDRFSGVQSVFKDSKFVLWATRGCRAENPLSNMVVGLVALFSPSVLSTLNAPVADLFPLPQDFDLATESQVLLGTLISESIISGIRWRIWLIANVAAAQGIDVFFSTSLEEDSNFDPAQVFIHSYANERDILSLLPENVEAFVNLGQENSVLMHIVEDDAILFNYGRGDLLKITRHHASTRAPKLNIDNASVSVAELKKLAGQASLTTILNWNDAESVESKISPLRPSDLFAANKTYLLVGLASQLGMSICDWMVKHGARNLVVTSRSPGRVDTAVLPLDITDKEGLLRLHKEVSETMPPIAGVANAAMVLNDKLFINMPKVKGTQNLDELFHSTPLDFFICFSSLTCVMGNPGQSNYAAANMGVAASIIDIAFLLGVGFVDRNLEQYEDHLKKFGYMRISEPEFHGPTSKEDPEIIIGIGEEPNAPWYSNPRFATYVRHESNEEDSDNQQAQSSQSVKGRLAAAKNSEDALAILQGACAEKLAMILQVHADVIDHSTPLLIRSWFLKEVNVDMPVLKILSGASLAEICQDALVLLPPTLISSAETSAPTADAAPAINNDLLSSANMQKLKVPSSAPTEVSTLKMEDTASALMSRASTGSSSVSEVTSLEELVYERVSEMTLGQSRLYFLNVYLEDKATYNVTMSGKLQGPFEVNRFKKALSTITRKHEGLRSSFFLNDATGKAMQGVGKEARIAVEHNNIQDNAEIQATLDAMKTTEFNLETGVWMKIQVLSSSRTQHHIIFTFHHIALDGVSWAIFLSELNKAYAGGDFSSPVQQAIDLANKQQQKAAPEKVQKELQFWKDVYSTLPEPLPLFPISRVQCRQLLKSYDTETLDIKQASGEMHVTPFHFYLSSIAAFVSRCLGVNDFSIGILDANRATAEDMTTIGYFTNILPLRFNTTANETFSTLAKRTRDITLAALSNSNADFDTILDNPLFQIAVNYRLGGSRAMPLDARNPYDLIIDISEIAEGTIISFTTQRYLYSAEDTNKLLTWYTHTVEGFANDTSRAAMDCLLATPSEIENAISLGRGESLEIDWKAPTLAHRVQEIASQYAGFIAVKDGYGQQLTYAQMMQRVGQIASQLSGLPAGSYVGILLHPAADSICALMAILILGLVYVPLDLRNPEGRLAAIVADCKPSAIIHQEGTQTTAENLSSVVEQSKAKLVCISKLPQDVQSSIQCVAEPNAPGFAIYTSGSTGTPKGVLLTHHALLNQIWAISKVFHLGQEVVLQQSSSGFDLHLEQIFSALANGGTVVVASKEARGDAIEIANLIFSEGVTYTVFVPSEYLYLLHYGSDVLKKCASWKFAFSGGEKITPQLRQSFKRLGLSDLQLINLYGPAEASLSCTRYTVPYATDNSEAASPAGLVQPNYTVVVADERGNPLPIGFPGEICIGGAGVASGYVNRPEETATKFIANTISPRQEIATRGWDKLYRTGDKGRMLESGLLDFMGRLEGDSQVKIRGMRIELEEIGNIIIESAGSAIVDAAVSLRSSDMLSAFVVFSDEFTEDKNVFLSQLRAKLPLPAYMCPTHIIAIDQIPRNASGKKDRAKISNLPLPSVVSGDGHNEGLTDLQAQVIAVWQDVLPTAIEPMQLSADSDFFFVGGNSLLLLKLRSELKMAFGCDLTLPELFQVSTVRDMALKIQTDGSENEPQGQSIDWTKELRSLCDGLVPRSDLFSTKSSATKSGLSVILTGATGFLGRHILQHLVNDERVSEIHCVAIRPGANGELRHVDISSPKITEYAGDLGDRNLGLSSSQLEDLVARADVIIHNGADVSFMKTYRSLRRPNVLSTRYLVEMALARSIPIHFVSTASVANFYVGKHLPETSIQGLDNLPKDGRNGYAASKWMSEALLESLADDHGVRSWIHRPTSIIGADAPEMDIVASLYNYSKFLKAVPRFPKAVSGTFDFVSVQSVANSIADAAVASVSADGKGSSQRVSYQHHCSDEKVPLQDFAKYMEKTEGGVFDELESKVWFEKAREAGLNRLVCEYLESTVGAGEILSLPTLLKGKNY